MGRPLLFIDFDGVINQFPDPKVMRRQGTTDWMRPDDPRRAAYAPDNWFRPDRRERLLVHDLGRRATSSAGTRSSWPDWTPWMRTNGGCPPGSRRQRN